jgi:hypothetical protein
VLLRQEFYDGESVWHFFAPPAMMLVAAMLLWFLIRSWRSARRERYLWTKPVPLWRELGKKVLSSGTELKTRIQARQVRLALPTSATKPLIEVRPVAKPVTTQQDTPTATAQIAIPPTQTSTMKSNGFEWDESKGIE